MAHYIPLLILALFVASSAGMTNEKIDIDLKFEDEQDARFPFFDKSVTGIIDPRVKHLAVEQAFAFLDLIKTAIFKELDEPRSTGFTGWMKLYAKLISLAHRQKNERAELGRYYPSEEEFFSSVTHRFTMLLNEAKVLHKQRPKVSPADLKFLIKRYIFSLESMIRLSPVGPFLFFEQGYVNGEPFQKATLDILVGLQKNNFRTFLQLLERLMKYIAKQQTLN